MKTHRILLLTLLLAPLAGCEEILAAMHGAPAAGGTVLRARLCPTHGSTPECPRGGPVGNLATPADSPTD